MEYFWTLSFVYFLSELCVRVLEFLKSIIEILVQVLIFLGLFILNK